MARIKPKLPGRVNDRKGPFQLEFAQNLPLLSILEESLDLSTLSSKVKAFCEDRDWDQFHGPKDLSIGLCTEASELLEHFRFKSPEQVETIMVDPEQRKQIGHELADVLFFLLRFSQRGGFDLAECLEDKMILNAKKYPVEKARGSNLKYDQL